LSTGVVSGRCRGWRGAEIVGGVASVTEHGAEEGER
jgi:hypothetical protein